MNKLVIVLISVLALVAAETKNLYVGCHHRPNHANFEFEAFEFFEAVEIANHHLDSRIHICCFLELYNFAFDVIGPVLIHFDHNVELIGTHPKHPFTCPHWNAERIESLKLDRLNCTSDKTGNCMRTNADLMEHEDFGDDLWEHPHAWIGTFGNWFIFHKKAKIERLGFIAEGGQTEETHNFIKNSPKVNTTKLFQNVLEGKQISLVPGDTLPNAIISMSQFFDYSYEFSVEKSVFGLSPFARFLTFDLHSPIFVWALVSLAQETVFEDVFIEALDFHLIARLSPVVRMSHIFMALYDNVFFELIEFIDGPVKRQDVETPWFYPQIELKIDDAFIGFVWIGSDDDEFPVAPVDLGVLSTYFPYLPEILRLHLDDVMWWNIDRFIAAGSYYTLLQNGWDFQEAKVDDRVNMAIFW